MAFVRVCARGDLPAGEGQKFEVGNDAIALFNVDGEFFAIEDECSHSQWSLSDGYLDGDRVECTLHMAKFCVRTGRACSLPATEAVMVFPVQINGDDVLVDIHGGHYAA